VAAAFALRQAILCEALFESDVLALSYYEAQCQPPLYERAFIGNRIIRTISNGLWIVLQS
jgi:hypothetical protein